MTRASQKDVVLISVVFSDLSQRKFRPAIVMSNDAYNRKSEDFVGIPLTTNPKVRSHTIPVSSSEMAKGTLAFPSVARADRIFSAKQRLIVQTFGQLSQDTFEKVRTELIKLIN
jgi:mRNA interferase MazF